MEALTGVMTVVGRPIKVLRYDGSRVNKGAPITPLILQEFLSRTPDICFWGRLCDNLPVISGD